MINEEANTTVLTTETTATATEVTTAAAETTEAVIEAEVISMVDEAETQKNQFLAQCINDVFNAEYTYYDQELAKAFAVREVVSNVFTKVSILNTLEQNMDLLARYATTVYDQNVFSERLEGIKEEFNKANKNFFDLLEQPITATQNAENITGEVKSMNFTINKRKISLDYETILKHQLEYKALKDNLNVDNLENSLNAVSKLSEFAGNSAMDNRVVNFFVQYYNTVSTNVQNSLNCLKEIANNPDDIENYFCYQDIYKTCENKFLAESKAATIETEAAGALETPLLAIDTI